MKIKTPLGTRDVTLAQVLKIGPSPLPLWLSFVAAVFVTVSAFDDVRLLWEGDSAGNIYWLGIAGTVGYWAVWMALAFVPKYVAPAFVLMLAIMLPQSSVGGPLLLAFGAVAVASYRVSVRSLVVMVGGFLTWQIVWVLGVAHLGSSTLWANFLVIPLLTAPGLAIKMLREKSVRAEQTRREAEITAARAALEERTALARELHDVVTHGLTMIAVQANLGTLSKDGTEQHEALVEIGGMARRSLDDLRRLLQTMREEEPRAAGTPEADFSVLTNPALIDLSESLAEAQQRLNNLGFPTRVTTSGDLDGTPNGLRSTVLSILQECTTNAVKHAGVGSECRITVAVQGQWLEMVIDNKMTRGKPRLPISGTGLVGLRERVARLDGTIDAGPADGWWSVRAVLPLAGRHTIH
ncbi:signal transduction histidine kinase [Arthrobacter stackebrandtii]|uniref:histidine kinase n=1 Tax=Arthrobacter stackebrandtii TaxID=272161 RepID=A0ABS4YXR1_9MICC|nr:histidine kinase [Arthrobacter stackebrandtii]MBP2412798.1 signal transduction histidine kinase [Arthrobacter stackebrandtii]PYG99850.1 hypothetical protein CVV67_12795 [Arthrobacter stackebrandtii]